MSLVRADAIAIPLADESVDLIVTSPPYFALRSYTDGGEHYAGQIGSEPTPQDFLEALWAVTAECVRVLKAMVARALGRYPVHIDLSADYLRLARWRIYDSGHAAKTTARTNRERQGTLL